MTDTNSDFPNTPTAPSASPAGYITPATSGSPETPRTSAQISATRNNFWELALSKVVEAVQGFFTHGIGSAFDQLQSWASNLWNAAWSAFNQIGQLISDIGGSVISDVSAVINNVFNGLANLTNNLLHDAASVIGAIPQTLVTGLTGAIGAINNAIGAATAFIQNVIDAILSALRGIPVIGGLIPDLTKAAKSNKVDAQNFTISAIVSDARNPTWVCRYPISDVTYPEFINNKLAVFGQTDDASTGTSHTHTIGNSNSAEAEAAGWLINQNESRGSYLTIANTTVHDTVGVVAWKQSGSLNNVYLEIFSESTTGALTRVFSQEFSSSITTTTTYFEFTLPNRLIVQSGERFLLRLRNSSSVATGVWLVGVELITSAAPNGFKTVGATDTNKTSYTAGEATTAQAAGNTLNWFMLAAKSLPDVARSWSDDANRVGIGGLWVGDAAAHIDIYEESFGYTGSTDGDQTSIYIRPCIQDVDRVEANLLINPASTVRCGVILHCARDFSQIVYLGVDSTSAKIYSGSSGSLTERASLSSGGSGKWALYYDQSADKYVALKDGAIIGLQWTSVGSAVTHDVNHRYGGIRISLASGEPAGTIDDWILRDWYVAVPATVNVAGLMGATADTSSATITAGAGISTTPMSATADTSAPSVSGEQTIITSAMQASAEMPDATPVVSGDFPYTFPFVLA